MAHPHELGRSDSSFRFSSGPRRVYWELTRACGLACRHCRATAQKRRDPNELTTEQIFEGLSAFAVADPRPVVVLTGGDPLERPDFFDILDYAKRIGLKVDVAPSVTPKLTPEIVAELAAHGVGAMSLSLDGSDAARHDALRGIDGCYEHTLVAAEHIRRARIPLQVNTLVTADTYPDLPRIRERVGQINAKRWSLFFLVTTGRGSGLPQIEPEQAERLFAWLIEIAPASPFVIATTEAPQFRRYLIAAKQGSQRVAGAGIRDGNGIVFISHTGEVMPSGFLPLSAGSLRESNPLTLYRESPLFVSLRDTDRFGGRCGVCEFKDVCGGSRGRAFAATGDAFAEDPLCAYQPSSTV